MADTSASNSATMPEGTRSLADEQGTGLDDLVNSQTNRQSQDVPMISQDDLDKISKSSDPQPVRASFRRSLESLLPPLLLLFTTWLLGHSRS